MIPLLGCVKSNTYYSTVSTLLIYIVGGRQWVWNITPASFLANIHVTLYNRTFYACACMIMIYHPSIRRQHGLGSKLLEGIGFSQLFAVAVCCVHDCIDPFRLNSAAPLKGRSWTGWLASGLAGCTSFRIVAKRKRKGEKLEKSKHCGR